MVSRSDRIFLFLLGAGFLLRLSLLDYPVHNPEALRDYLVARHIVHYGEVPLAGPCCLWNSFFGFFRHSPVIYYLLAALVALRDDIFFLSLVNLFLQMAVMVMVYVMVKRLFSPATAILTTLLLVVNWEITKQSLSVWQPYLAQGVGVASFFVLFLSWGSHRFLWQVASVALFVAAVGFHPSYAGLFPSVFLLHLLLLRKEKRLLTKTVLLFIAGAATAAVFFLPLGMPAMQVVGAGIIIPPTLYLGKVKEVVDALVKVWFPSGAAALFVLGVVVYLFRAAAGIRKQLYLLLLLAMVQFLVVMSLFQTPAYTHYLTPILLAVAILVAETVLVVPQQFRLPRMVAVSLMVLLVVAASRGGYVLRALATPKIAPSIAKATASLAKEFAGSTFGVVVYPKQAESPIHTDLLLAVPLEKALGRKILMVDDSKFSYQLPAGGERVAVLCLIQEQERCVQQYAYDYPGYRVEKTVYADERMIALFISLNMEPEIVAIKRTKDLDMQVRHYRTLIKRLGVEDAQEALYRSGLPFDGQTHLLNHTAGDILYEQYGTAGLVQCKDYFLSSCYHGFVIHAIGSGGIESLKQVMNVCNQKGHTVAIQCAHAIGHGILASVGYRDFPTSLTECDRVATLSDKFPLYNCHDGAFMENIWAVHESGKPSKDRWLKDGDLLYPCNEPRIAPQYLKACWSNQPMRIYQMTGGDVAMMGRVCLGVSDTVLQATCFDGAARQIHPVARGQVAEVFRLCRLIPEAWQAACVASIVRAEFSVGGRTLPFTLCEAIWESGRESCNSALEEIIRAYISDRARRQTYCRRIMSETAQRQCLGYGGGVP